MAEETRIVIQHASGLHARPASVFVQTASRYKANIQVTNLTSGKGPVSAKSILSVLTLGVGKGFVIHLAAEGPDARPAIQALEELVASNFGEEQA